MKSKPNCIKHKKEVAGISDMKLLAELVGDLHYETLADFLQQLALKINSDGVNDFNAGRKTLGKELIDCSEDLGSAWEHMAISWIISKPFMNNQTLNHGK